MKIKTIIPAALMLTLLCSCNSSAPKAIPTDKEVEQKVESVLKKMTLEQKAGQMVQINVSQIYDEQKREVVPDRLNYIIKEKKIGSILNVPSSFCPSPQEMAEIVKAIQAISIDELEIPCLIGLDMIHGASYYCDGTLFPQEVNLGATFNPEYAGAMGKAIGYETRAGLVPWVFSPVMDLSRNSLWPRGWESWGEDPYLQCVMAEAETRAIQGDDPNHIDRHHCAVSLKHYLGYGNPVTGKDRTPACIDYPTLREKYFAPFKACIEAGALTIMVNSASINGIPVHANRELLTGWAKEELGWDGMIVTDWADINNLYTRERIAVDKKDALRIGINAGIDMVMEPYDPLAADLICELVREGKISKSRIDDAVRRILRVKVRLGLFDDPMWDITDYTEYGSEQLRKASYDAAVESEVLLKNEGGLLPLDKGCRILVTGPTANSTRTLNGGWTYSWQGSDNPEYAKGHNTIVEALSTKFARVNYVPTVTFSNQWGNWQAENVVDFSPALAAAKAADVVVVCLGENSYCETPGNINDLEISENQTALVNALKRTGKPIVTILNEGRPRIVREIEALSDAVVDVMLPGNYGGDALAALLCGEENFSGKLPFTYPKWVNSIHTYDYKVSENMTTMEGAYNYDAKMDVQWAFGDGLSYTTFAYSNLLVSKTEFTADDVLDISVDVQNTGSVAGKESVLLFSSDMVASTVPDVRRLRAFSKVDIEPGQTATVSFSVPARELGFVGQDCTWTLEEGDFRIAVGSESVIVHCTATEKWN